MQASKAVWPQRIKRDPLRTCCLGLALAAVLVAFVVACGRKEDEAAPSARPEGPETFTFFDLGRTSRFSDKLREELAAKLGNDAIEHRSIIDLELNYRGFLEEHLPEVAALNRELNDPPGERVDHSVFKLMYRYARKKNVPFDYVELLFDGSSRLPVLFRIRFRTDEAGTLQALQEKYGAPQVITWGAEDGRSMVWHKEGDYLIASRVPEQFARPGHHILFVFTENMGRMIDSERAAGRTGGSGKPLSDRNVF
jgi:hypothetical protein